VSLRKKQTAGGQTWVALRLRLVVLALLGSTSCLAPQHAAAADEPAAGKPPLWRDPAQPLDVRVRDLVGRMTLDEKARQICN